MATTKGVANVERRKWDLDEYRTRADERAMRDNEEVAAAAVGKRRKDVDEVFPDAPDGSKVIPGSKRAFLEVKDRELKIDDRIGKFEVVTAAGGPRHGGGFWCDVCECLLKDSLSFASHMNGRKHQRRLGFSLRVERSTVDQVKDRLSMHKRRRAEEEEQKESGLDEYERRLARLQEEEEERQRKVRDERRRRKLAAQAEAQAQAQAQAQALIDDAEGEGEDDEESTPADEGATPTPATAPAQKRSRWGPKLSEPEEAAPSPAASAEPSQLRAIPVPTPTGSAPKATVTALLPTPKMSLPAAAPAAASREGEESEDDDPNAQMMAMMGFASFGKPKK